MKNQFVYISMILLITTLSFAQQNNDNRAKSSTSTAAKTSGKATILTKEKDSATTTLSNEITRGRHTCLICGRKHRGICKTKYSEETVNIKDGGIFKCSCCDKYFDTAILAYNHSKTCSKCTTTSTPTSTVGMQIINNDSWYNKETGQITYFEYTEDFVIDAPEICTDLGVKRLIIQKGKYTVERKTTEEGGKIVLLLKEPIAVDKIKNTASRKFEGTNPKGLNCNGPGNACFYVSGEKNRADMQPFTLTPVIEKGQCTNVVVQYEPSGKGAGSPKQQGF